MVDESVGEPMRLWIGGDGGDLLPVGPWVNDTGPWATNANDDVIFEEDLGRSLWTGAETHRG